MDSFEQQEKDLLGREGTTVEELRRRHEDCPRMEVLLASQAEVLPEEVARNVGSHLEKCRFCQVLVRDLAGPGVVAATPDAERRVRERVFAEVRPKTQAAKAGSSFFAGWFWTAVPIAALGAAVVALLLWAPWRRSFAPPVAPVAVAPQAPNAVPSHELTWEKLPIHLEASSILVWRGAPRTDKEKYAAALTAALTPYKDDNFGAAVTQLASVVKHFPRGVEAQLYLGVSRIKLEQNSEAIEPLTKAQQLGPEEFGAHATWYLALADERTGRVQNAIAELQRLCDGKNEYSARACSAARALAGNTPPNR